MIPVGDLIAYFKKNQNAPRPSEFYSILVSLLVDIRVFDYARMLYGIQLIFRSITKHARHSTDAPCSVMIIRSSQGSY